MTNEDGDSPDRKQVSQPLPPEVPVPTEDPEAADDESQWWRSSAPTPHTPAPGTDPPPKAAAAPGSDADSPPAPSTDDGPPDVEWWRTSGGEEQAQGTWTAHGSEGLQAAYEIGAQIGEAVAAHLPDPHAAAAKHKLDIRWLRLKYNVPGIVIALLVTWGGRSSFDRMAAFVETEGILAPVGFVLIFVLLGLALRVLPIGSALGAAFSNLISWLAHGLFDLLGRAWSLPYVGYMLRLAVAVAAWSFVLAVGRLIWRWAVYVLTGA